MVGGVGWFAHLIKRVGGGLTMFEIGSNHLNICEWLELLWVWL